MKIISIVIISLFFVHVAHANDREKKPLGDLLLIIDVGHGGIDSGSMVEIETEGGTKTIYEPDYAYDIACRLHNMVIARGGIALFTLRDDSYSFQEPLPCSALRFIPHEKRRTFALDGSQVKPDDTRNLLKRTKYAQSARKSYDGKKVVFISLHFDNFNRETVNDYVGSYIIVPYNKTPEIARFLEEEFRKKGLLRQHGGEDHYPIARANFHAKNVIILRRKNNPIRQRVLIELGNMTKPLDQERMLGLGSRDDYAIAIVNALLQAHELPLQKMR